MKLQLRCLVLVKLCIIVGSCLVGACSAPASRESAIESESVSMCYPSLESLKEGVPWASKWWSANVRGKVFVICLQEPPSYGQSRQDVCAWRQTVNGSFALVWSFRPVGVGPVDVELREEVGTVIVRARGYTDIQDSVIAMAQLSATTD